jgi:hypothetical protein
MHMDALGTFSYFLTLFKKRKVEKERINEYERDNL